MQAAVAGTKEIGLAVLATTLSLVIVFLPVSFLSSVTGRMLYEFGVTASVAIMVSLLVSFSLTPMMCSRLLKPAQAGRWQGAQEPPRAVSPAGSGLPLVPAPGHALALGRLPAGHRRRSRRSCPLYGLIKQDYVPTNVDEGEFEIRIHSSRRGQHPHDGHRRCGRSRKSWPRCTAWCTCSPRWAAAAPAV